MRDRLEVFTSGMHCIKSCNFHNFQNCFMEFLSTWRFFWNELFQLKQQCNLLNLTVHLSLTVTFSFLSKIKYDSTLTKVCIREAFQILYWTTGDLFESLRLRSTSLDRWPVSSFLAGTPITRWLLLLWGLLETLLQEMTFRHRCVCVWENVFSSSCMIISGFEREIDGLLMLLFFLP